MECCS